MNEDIKDMIINKYKLSPDQIEQITNTIIESLAYGKSPSQNPLAIVVGGQSGAGKTALINYQKQISSQRSFITIDNDYFRGFHPQANKIRELYPDYFRQATDQLGMGITSDVVNYFVSNNYDIIFHQTLRNNRVADDAISKFRQSGYTVGVSAFAVPYFQSKLSQIQRCISQIDKLGYCRYVQADSHVSAYLHMPETVNYIQQNGMYDFIQVFKRSENIAKPTSVYTVFNPDTFDKTLQTISNCEKMPKRDETHGFFSAKDAIIRTRAQEVEFLAPTFDQQITQAENSAFTPELITHIQELKSAFELYQQDASTQKTLQAIASSQQYNNNPELQDYIFSIADSFHINLFPQQEQPVLISNNTTITMSE